MGPQVPAHSGPPGSPRSKPLRPLHTQPPLGQRCQRLGRILEPRTSLISSHWLPGCPELPGSPRSKPLRPLHSWPSLGQTQALQGGLRSNPSGRHTGSGGDKTTAEDQLNPGAEQLRKRPENLPSSGTSCIESTRSTRRTLPVEN